MKEQQLVIHGTRHENRRVCTETLTSGLLGWQSSKQPASCSEVIAVLPCPCCWLSSSACVTMGSGGRSAERSRSRSRDRHRHRESKHRHRSRTRSRDRSHKHNKHSRSDKHDSRDHGHDRSRKHDRDDRHDRSSHHYSSRRFEDRGHERPDRSTDLRGAYVSNFSSGGRIHEDNGGLPLPDAYQVPVDPYQAGNTDVPNQYRQYGSGLQGGKRLDTSSLTPHVLCLLKGVVKSSTDAIRLMQPCIG